MSMPPRFEIVWHKAGILPIFDPELSAMPSIPIISLIEAEQRVTDALVELEGTGVLQPMNRLTLEDLLNPLDESTDIEQPSDAEIYKAVMEAHQVDEDVENGSITVDGEVESYEPFPTREEFLDASAIIKRYVDSFDDPTARKLYFVLNSFRRNLRLGDMRSTSTKTTYITDHFSVL